MDMSPLVTALVSATCVLASAVRAADLLVPAQYPTIQGAIAAADGGVTMRGLVVEGCAAASSGSAVRAERSFVSIVECARLVQRSHRSDLSGFPTGNHNS